MTPNEKLPDRHVHSLQERAKELACLYAVDEILDRREASLEEICRALVEAIPAGWQYPESCVARISVEGREYAPAGFTETPWRQAAKVAVEGEMVGEAAVYYTVEKPEADEGPFLKEERRLISAIAERIGLFLLQRRLRQAPEAAAGPGGQTEPQRWAIILEFLRRTDRRLLARITRKMINYLCWSGVKGAEALLQRLAPQARETAGQVGDENRPLLRTSPQIPPGLTDEAFALAASHLKEQELFARVQMWIEEDRSSFLMDTLEKGHSTLAEIAEAIERYRTSEFRESDLPVAVQKTLRVSLLRRLFTDQLDFLKVAKDYVDLDDMQSLLQRSIYSSRSRGKLGGKSAGLYLARQILKEAKESSESLREVKCPKTWYITSDSMLDFIHFNNLEDLYDQKYVESETIRRDYPHIIQVFKNSHFPPEIVKGLAVVLDDFENRPLIVRSSSLLEDRSGAAFSGKYKSLFLANQGRKKQRLEALQDAIAEVYASIFSPDPLEYRAERGLLDFHEEMGIMIQEVVGRRIGPYFLPAYAGVAYSNNEFRWSPRIRREDGLVRLVPGLGSRAVDRVSDDFPVLIAPGQPGLRVNATPDEIVRYSPKKIDVINLETNAFETVDLRELLSHYGEEYPGVRDLISVVEQDRILPPSGLGPDWETDDIVVNFEGLISRTDFVARIRGMMELLREELDSPVDLEFASDGADLYLVQCRAQSYSADQAPAAIPRDLPRDQILFTAGRYISNGRVPDITHIVYVDPERYAELGELRELKDVGRALGRLNKLLPKRQFILMGPGRWGSRGDVKLGVSVTYADINNTAVLVEIARRKGNYLPELSFGTHFFQDLVEAEIRYIPLYPDDPGVVFDETFLRRARNILPDILPEYAHVADTICVIDVPREREGRILRILMNADLDEAVGVMAEPTTVAPSSPPRRPVPGRAPEEHWRWRARMAEKIAEQIDAERFGVHGLYVFGSAKNATAGPGSDIDLIVHFSGDTRQREELMLWLDGWSRSLAEINYLRTGYRSEGLLDVHLVTDEDVSRKTSFAAKIDAVTDAARPLAIGGRRIHLS